MGARGGRRDEMRNAKQRQWLKRVFDIGSGEDMARPCERRSTQLSGAHQKYHTPSTCAARRSGPAPNSLVGVPLWRRHCSARSACSQW